MERLYRPICDLLACRYPLVLAGMGGVARAELVLAVTRGGGFGFLGMVREPVALLRAEIERIRAHSDRRFGVNLIPASTPPELLEAQIDRSEEHTSELQSLMRISYAVFCLKKTSHR